MGKIKHLFVRIINLTPSGLWPGFLAGFIYFSFIFWWFWDLYPLDSFGLENELVAGIILMATFLLYVTIMALPWGVFSLLLKKIIYEKCPDVLISLLIASTFTLAEYFRTIFFSTVLYGSGGVIGPHWTMGNIAYWFVDFDLIASTASVWGIYGINFVLILLFSSILLLFLKVISKKNFLTSLLIALILVSLAAFISFSNKGLNESAPIPIAIIQTNTPSVEFTNNTDLFEDFKKKLDLVQEGSEKIKEGLILFPEGTGFSTSLAQILDVVDIRQYFNGLSDLELLVVDSIRSPENSYYKSKAAFISSKTGVIDFYDKEILVPGGEFLPYLIKLPLILIKPSLKDEFRFYREYSAGEKSNIITYKNKQIKTIVCSDFISPAKSRNGQSDYILSLGSFSVWGSGQWTVQQAEPMLRFRAIENGKYLAFASNGGRSYIINPAGDIEKATLPNSYELLTGRIVPNSNQTWYNKLGDWPILLASFAFLGLGVIKTYRVKTD